MLVTSDTYDEALAFLQDQELICADTETNYVQHDEDRYIMGIACLSGGRSFYFPFRHSHDFTMFPEANLDVSGLSKLCRLLCDKTSIWHNAKFDLRQLAKEVGEEAVAVAFFYDTLKLSHMENENKYSHELEALAPLVDVQKLKKSINEIAEGLGGGVSKENPKLIARAKGWVKIPPSVMGMYAEIDVEATWKLCKVFISRVKAEGQLDLYPREAKVVQLIRRMEDNGVPVNREKLLKTVEETQQKLEQLQSELGYDPMKPSQLAHRLYALPSAGGLGLSPLGYSKRPSKEFARGIPIMDTHTIARHKHPEIEKISRYRSLVHDLSTYYQGWLDKLDSRDLLHPNFGTTTVTTRWKCSEPNMQQLPRDVSKSPIKKQLGGKALEGYELWEFDYSQAEFRFGVVYVGDEEFDRAIREGADIHAITAQQVGAYDKFPEQPELARYVGKQANFLIINRGGWKVLKKQLWENGRLEFEDQFLKDTMRRWHEEHPKWELFASKVEQAALSRGFIKLWNGRIRHFGKFENPRSAFNSLVQGGVAQIMTESLLLLDEANFKLCAQIHDAAWVWIPTGEVEQKVQEVKEIMEWPSKPEPDGFGFPFPVDAKRLA